MKNKNIKILEIGALGQIDLRNH